MARVKLDAGICSWYWPTPPVRVVWQPPFSFGRWVKIEGLPRTERVAVRDDFVSPALFRAEVLPARGTQRGPDDLAACQLIGNQLERLPRTDGIAVRDDFVSPALFRAEVLAIKGSERKPLLW